LSPRSWVEWPISADRYHGWVPTRLPSLRRPPIAFAHRGARAHAPENTIEAFELALRLGATGLESDAWLTSDGRAVLDHDGVVGGRLRRHPIGQTPRSELPAHIPELDQLYETCGTAFELSLDLKDEAVAGAVVASAEAAGAGTVERLWLCHPDLETLVGWRQMWPQVRLVHSTSKGHLRGGSERHAATLAEHGIDAVNLHQSEWSGGLTTLYHRFERLSFAWDVQFEPLMHELIDSGIDALYSDHVDRLMTAVARSA
jgi:glycerophosphoryl diester phosphodiesterase